MLGESLISNPYVQLSVACSLRVCCLCLLSVHWMTNGETSSWYVVVYQTSAAYELTCCYDQVEGIITIGVALILFVIFPAEYVPRYVAIVVMLIPYVFGSPSKTRIFNEQERQLSKARFFADQPAISQHKEAISLKLVKQALTSPVTLACIWLYICNNITVQGLSIFTVSILR
jgi:hypothetical protein